MGFDEHRMTNPASAGSLGDQLKREVCVNYTRPEGVMGGPCLNCGASQPEHTERPKMCTTSGEPVEKVRAEQTSETGQHAGYIVLCPDERARGFVRPYRDAYKHTLCGTVTTMGRALSETYARQPTFYSHTFCVHCNRHLPVAQFTWTVDGQVVGS